MVEFHILFPINALVSSTLYAVCHCTCFRVLLPTCMTGARKHSQILLVHWHVADFILLAHTNGQARKQLSLVRAAKNMTLKSRAMDFRIPAMDI